MALAFHAAPPAGQWINDPNGLLFADGAYRLFAQHRADEPEFRATGWARFSSPDLLHWSFDGPAIAPEADLWMYSGSVVGTPAGLEALHTTHRAGVEQQVRRTSVDGGARWSPAEPLASLGAPAANRRDPFVFQDADGWGLLLSEPCDWTHWREQPPSRLLVYRSSDRRAWRQVGAIGPWSAPGVMWEVPVLAHIDGHAVLFLSLVDRREERTACSVRAWIGAFDGVSFERHSRSPAEGLLVDFGPDFYALMSSTPWGWPLPQPLFVAWLSNWRTARRMPWPGFAGGPISLPRELSVEVLHGAPRLACRPAADVVARFDRFSATTPRAGLGTARWPGDRRFQVSLRSPRSSAIIDGDPATGALNVRRTGAEPLALSCSHDNVVGTPPERTLRVFIDGPVVEIFSMEDGVAVSLALGEDAAAFEVEAAADGPAPITWATHR